MRALLVLLKHGAGVVPLQALAARVVRGLRGQRLRAEVLGRGVVDGEGIAALGRSLLLNR